MGRHPDMSPVLSALYNRFGSVESRMLPGLKKPLFGCRIISPAGSWKFTMGNGICACSVIASQPLHSVIEGAQGSYLSMLLHRADIGHAQAVKGGCDHAGLGVHHMLN